MNRYDCLELLASWVADDVLAATCLTDNSNMWRALRPQGANFYSLNLGHCLPFAVGLCLAFPKHKVLALDGDGSLMIDASALILAAEVNPDNLLAIVFDNQAYAKMGETSTAHRTDLAAMAKGAGIERTATLRTLDEFREAVPDALATPGATFFVAKVEQGERFKAPRPRITERGMKEMFLQAIRRFPDHPGIYLPGPGPAT